MMKISYLVEITDPQNHIVKVKISGDRPKQVGVLNLFLPSWSPGSYYMREYSRNIRKITANAENGEPLHIEQTNKGRWSIDWSKSETNKQSNGFELVYEIYCKELTVRTSHVDITHAFLHGPSYLMGVEGVEIATQIEFKFPAIWSKLTTSLKDISAKREIFLYQANSYDELIDCPVEIGCHETDGFMSEGIPHELAFYGQTFDHEQDLKGDIKTIVDHISSLFGGKPPYEKYCFITHFQKNLFGGLEHHNSTALQYDGRLLNDRKDYINWLALVSHEYFHLWNIKRIRPVEYGPFDYTNEVYSTMLWLAEGLTSFVDELFVYQAKLCLLEEYLEMTKNHLNRFLETPGRRFHSLEQSSYNAWIKLYRPDENTANSTVSYYTKGGLVFFVLNVLLNEKGKSVGDLISLLWQRYLDNPKVGVKKTEVLELIKELGGDEVRDEFDTMLTTTFDIDFEKYFNLLGLELEKEESRAPYWGVSQEFKGDNLWIKSVVLDGPAYKAGINSGDEILAINGQRWTKDDQEKMEKILRPNRSYQVLLSRGGRLVELDFMPSTTPTKIKQIKVVDQKKVDKYLIDSWIN